MTHITPQQAFELGVERTRMERQVKEMIMTETKKEYKKQLWFFLGIEEVGEELLN